MPKLKTKAVCKRRFKLTATGKIKRFRAGKNHFMRNKSSRALNTAGQTLMTEAENARIITKKWMPYI